MAPSEFWGLSLSEFVSIYEISRDEAKVGRVTQSQVDDMLTVQDKLDAGMSPADAMRGL